MAGHKQFKAVPIQLGKRYRKRATADRFKSTAKVLGLAALGGSALGLVSVAVTSGAIAKTVAAIKPAAVSIGLVRARSPKAGDYWYRCDDARAAGSTPIYRGEPGYREVLDSDNDGLACEPYRGIS